MNLHFSIITLVGNIWRIVYKQLVGRTLNSSTHRQFAYEECFLLFLFHLSLFLFLPRSFLSPSSLIYSYDKNGSEHSEPLLAQVSLRIF